MSVPVREGDILAGKYKVSKPTMISDVSASFATPSARPLPSRACAASPMDAWRTA